MKYTFSIVTVLIVCLTFSNTGNAQNAPGLYGKQLFVELGGSFSHNSTGIRYNEKNYSEGVRILYSPVGVPILFSMNYQFQAHYAVSRRITFGTQITYAQMGYKGGQVTVSSNVKALNVNVFRRKYWAKTGAIAPLGYYSQVGISAFRYNTAFTTSSLYTPTSETIGGKSFLTPALNLELGKQTIINDKLLLGLAIQSTIITDLNIDEQSKVEGIEAGFLEATSAYGRLLRHFLFRFKMTVGLPF